MIYTRKIAGKRGRDNGKMGMSSEKPGMEAE
jgi:hypothetical protein